MPMVVGVVGGALLAIGSFLTWASATFDVGKLAQALGIDPTLIAGVNRSESVSGFQGGSDGKFTLIAGIAVVIFAIVLFVKADLGKVMGGLMVVAGVIGGGVALYDLSKINDVKDEALASATPLLQQAGVDPGVFNDVIKVSAGIGIYLCVIGGIVAIVAGIMALIRKQEPSIAMGAGAGTMAAASMGTGFEAPAAATPPPSAPPAPPAPESAAPAAPPAPEPAPQSAPEPAGPDASAGGDEGGSTSTT